MFGVFEASVLETREKQHLISYFRARSVLFANTEPESIKTQMDLLKHLLNYDLQIPEYNSLYQYLLSLKFNQKDTFQE